MRDDDQPGRDTAHTPGQPKRYGPYMRSGTMLSAMRLEDFLAEPQKKCE